VNQCNKILWHQSGKHSSLIGLLGGNFSAEINFSNALSR
jgi:hypothetical protein